MRRGIIFVLMVVIEVSAMLAIANASSRAAAWTLTDDADRTSCTSNGSRGYDGYGVQATTVEGCS